jgi:hypothetical protein
VSWRVVRTRSWEGGGQVSVGGVAVEGLRGGGEGPVGGGCKADAVMRWSRGDALLERGFCRLFGTDWEWDIVAKWLCGDVLLPDRERGYCRLFAAQCECEFEGLSQGISCFHLYFWLIVCSLPSGGSRNRHMGNADRTCGVQTGLGECGGE